MNIHEKYIKRCIELAKNGLGETYPNPMVGSVIVLNDVIIGEGWHRKAGEPHAEVNAINSVKDLSLLKNATIYVSLEPCSHFGKTPPCANLIVANGIKNVVIGSIDSNAKVSGRGVQYLKNQNCNVIVGVLEDQCKELNKRFFTFHTKKRPYIILKWAETTDGFIDKMRDETSENLPNWISNQYSQQRVHKMRAVENAILIGTTTALNDNPSLNVRSWSGNNPVRVVLDRILKIPKNYNIYDGTVKTIVLTEKPQNNSLHKNVLYEEIDFSDKVTKQVCDVLYKHEIQSVLIEGGSHTLQGFIDENLYDEVFIFEGNVLFGNGLKAPQIKKSPSKIEKISTDVLKVYINNSKARIILEKDTYKTIDIAKGDVLFKDKGSKFIGYAFPITSEDEVKINIEKLKQKHHSARHWCYAWQLGVEELRYRANDDGEPNNSAGQPIYGQLLSFNITNVLVVVVRYFGGTKLGIGGLINAYKTTSKLVLEESIIVEKTIDIYFQLIFDYKDMNKVMRIVKENNIEIKNQTMNLNCNYLISIRKKNAKKIEQLFTDLRCLKIKEVKQ